MDITPLLTDIDATLRPKGGRPLVTAGQLNALLRALTTELAAGLTPAPVPGVRVRAAFGPGQPITFEQDADFENQGQPLTEGFDGQHSLAAFSYAGAVRGATVRVEYYAPDAYSLPPTFNLLNGPLPGPNVKTVLYLRYVREGVVDVTVGTSEPGTYLGRFWAYEGQTDLGLGLYMGQDTQVLAVSSEGRRVRSGAYNGGGPLVHFAATTGPRYVDLYAYAGSRTLHNLAGVMGGLGPKAGEINLDATLPDLDFDGCLLQFSRDYTKVIVHKPTLGLGLGFRYNNTPLDLSECVVAVLDVGNSYCTKLVPPPPNPYLTALYMPEHRLYNQELVFPDLPHLAVLDLGIGQPLVSRLNRLDVSQLPALANLNANLASVQTLVFGDNPLDHLARLDLRSGRLTGRPEPFGQGNIAEVAQALGRAHQLAYLDLGFNGLTETETNQVVQVLLAALPQAVPGSRTLTLADYPGETTFNFYDNGYPHSYNHDANFGYTYNAPVVSAATRASIGQLVAGGWVVTYNQFVPLHAEYVAEGPVLRGTYAGPAAIDVWAVGDEVQLQSTDPTHLPGGRYVVVAGSGTTWDLRPAGSPAPALAAFEPSWVAVLPHPV